MAESEEELKNLLMRVKEESAKAGSKLNIEKTKIMASGLINTWSEFCHSWKGTNQCFFFTKGKKEKSIFRVIVS